MKRCSHNNKLRFIPMHRLVFVMITLLLLFVCHGKAAKKGLHVGIVFNDTRNVDSFSSSAGSYQQQIKLIEEMLARLKPAQTFVMSISVPDMIYVPITSNWQFVPAMLRRVETRQVKPKAGLATKAALHYHRYFASQSVPFMLLMFAEHSSFRADSLFAAIEYKKNEAVLGLALKSNENISVRQISKDAIPKLGGGKNHADIVMQTIDVCNAISTWADKRSCETNPTVKQSLILLDLSNSMLSLSGQNKITRLTNAQKCCEQIISVYEQVLPDHEIGIMAFATDSTWLSLPSMDSTSLRKLCGQVSPSMLKVQGTSIQNIPYYLEEFFAAGRKQAELHNLFLVSDGEFHDSTTLDSLKTLKLVFRKLHIVSIATQMGIVRKIGGQGEISAAYTKRGRRAVSRPDPIFLLDAAVQTDAYFYSYPQRHFAQLLYHAVAVCNRAQ